MSARDELLVEEYTKMLNDLGFSVLRTDTLIKMNERITELESAVARLAVNPCNGKGHCLQDPIAYASQVLGITYEQVEEKARCALEEK
jgi:hypothetical protein